MMKIDFISLLMISIFLYNFIDCNAANSDQERGVCTIAKLSQGSSKTAMHQNREKREGKKIFSVKETVGNSNEDVNGKGNQQT